MGKLLYITVNTKPENLSSSRTVARALVNRFMEKHPDYSIEELDLYQQHIPQLKYSYFESRNVIAGDDAIKKLPPDEQAEIAQIKKLCDQFISANVYVLAAPMWSLSFPSPLKEYIDCIVQADKTITFKNNKPQGLLNDKPRTFVYVQSSGAAIPWVLRPVLNKGLNYVEDIMKELGIAKFCELLVDGTGTTESERIEAITNAESKIDDIIDSMQI
jgi:FMN-dependent NADH-azoreductase